MHTGALVMKLGRGTSWMIGVALVGMAAGLLGCLTPAFRRAIVVGRDEFVRYWELPTKSGGVRVVYRGVQDGYHILDYYDLGWTTYNMDYRYTLMTPEGDLAADVLLSSASDAVMLLSERKVDQRAAAP